MKCSSPACSACTGAAPYYWPSLVRELEGKGLAALSGGANHTLARTRKGERAVLLDGRLGGASP